jgi:hypothetical protein
MDHFPDGKEKVGDITLIDGSTAKFVKKLVCKRCFVVFPPTSAKYPEHVFVKPDADPASYRSPLEV